ncbi:MAG: hypothetical protein WA087_03580 [Candidatus Saccharimonadales bacterium]
MKNHTKNLLKQNKVLIVTFIIGAAFSAAGYILRGTVNAPSDPATEGLGALVGGLGGLILFVWFCMSIIALLKNASKKN